MSVRRPDGNDYQPSLLKDMQGSIARHLKEKGYKHNHTIIRAAFVCVFVCLFIPYVLRGPLTDLRQTWWVYVGGPPICP